MFKRSLSIALVFLLLFTCTAQAASALQYGAKSDEVKALQERLIKLGLLDGPADGVFGAMTQAAVKGFQSCLNDAGHTMTVDGIAGRTTQKYLADPSVESIFYDLGAGSRGYAVQRLQQRLIDLNFLDDYADGVFGEATRGALYSFQALLCQYGADDITPTGFADKATIHMLYSDLSDYHIIAPMYFDESKPLALQTGYLYCQTAILINANTGEVIFSKKPDQMMYPASTTKIMTALLALENTSLSKVVTIPKEAADVPEDSSLVPVTVGEKMTMEDLLHGLMLRSGNDAANAIAVLTAGSTDKFVSMMNMRAAELGMTGTNFANPHGYQDDNHYTTARDLATLTRIALQNADFKTLVSSRTYTMAKTQKRDALTLTSTYYILNPDSSFYYPYAFGIKTGYTSSAGYCYVCAAEKNGKTLIAVVMNDKQGKQWVDAKRLFEYGFAK